MPVTGNSGQRGHVCPMGVAAGAASRALPFVTVLVGLVLIFGWLGGDHLVGDEHNVIYFLKDGFWDYMKSFHYGHTLKAQVWAIHALFGNSFFWYRIPAAVAIACFVVWLTVFRNEGLPANRVTQALVVLFVAGNVRLLFFARWGMPNYGESILLEALLLGMLIPDVIAGRMPAWTKWRLLIMAVLPWLYPATVILLGAISGYLWLLVVLAVFAPGVINASGGFARRMFAAAVPLLVGGISLFIYRLSVPDQHWNRARGLHSSFSDWVGKGEGGAISFMLHSLTGVGKEILTLAPVKGGKFAVFVTQAYAWLGISIGVAIVVALAVVTVRAMRLRGSIPEIDRNFLRAGGFLAICILASTVVVLGAQLLNAFPTGGLRHLFFLIPALALLAVISTGYLVCLASLALPGGRMTTVGRMLASIAVMLLGGAMAVAVSQNRFAAEKEWNALFSLFHSPANDITFSFSPGFYVSPSLQPRPGHYFMVDAGNTVPGAVQQAVEKKAEDTDGGRIAILVKRESLDDAGSALNAFIAGNGLHLEQVARSGSFAALALTIPHRVVIREPREIEVTVDLPASAIVSVRLDPTQFTESSVTVESILLADAYGEHVIDVCSDAKLQMVRTVRVGDGSGCSLVLGNAANTGWFAPSALRNLAASTAPRKLHIRMTGELSDEFRVYFDVGAGYDSPVRIKVNAMAPK